MQVYPFLEDYLRSLTWLGLGGTSLAEIPTWIGKLTCLDSISIRGRPVVVLPESMSRLERLRVLDIQGHAFLFYRILLEI